MTTPSFFPSPALDQAAAGITAGAVSTMLLHPLDVVKTRLQVTLTASPSFLGNAIRSFRSVVTSQGVGGLYRGLSPNVAGSTVSWGLYFFCYSRIKDGMRGRGGGGGNEEGTRSLSAPQHLAASACAGAVTALVTNPLWVVKTRMCTSAVTDPGAYRGLSDGLYQITKQEGLRGLYRGMIPALFGVSHGALQFMAYEEMKKRRTRKKREHGESSDRSSTTEYTIMAASSKLFATVMTYPYQVLRSRLQVKGSTYRGVWDCTSTMFRTEGLVGFYKGLVPNVIRVMPGTCITFAVYESVSEWLRNRAREGQR